MAWFRLPHFPASRAALLAPAALLLCAAAQAAPPAHAHNSQYTEDRAACASVPAPSRTACLREAGAAAQAARTGQLASRDAGAYDANALARCQAFKTPQDQSDCEARVRSSATLSGSVEGGGVLREAVTPVQ